MSLRKTATAAICALVMLPSLVRADDVVIDRGEQLYIRNLASQLNGGDKANLVATLYAYNMDCQKLDATIIVESNLLARESPTELLKDANDLTDFTLRKGQGLEWFCNSFLPLITAIKEHSSNRKDAQIP